MGAPFRVGLESDFVCVNERGACENVLSVLRGQVPRHVVNREVLQKVTLAESAPA